MGYTKLGGGASSAKEWTEYTTSDTNANDSDKSITVPASKISEVRHIRVDLTTTATAGDRQLVIEYKDSGGTVIAESRAQVVQAAALQRYYDFDVSGSPGVAFYDTDSVTQWLPSAPLFDSYTIRVYDNNAVDAAADDMLVYVTGFQRDE